MSGAAIHTVAQLLGRKDLRMASRCQHLSPSFLADAGGKLDAVFGTVCYPDVTPKTPCVVIGRKSLKINGGADGTRTRDLCLERAAC